MDLKNKIVYGIVEALKQINCGLNETTVESYLEVPKEKENGDFSFPCFRLAKELRKSPIDIANDLKEKIKVDYISKIEVVNRIFKFLCYEKQDSRRNIK